MSLHVILEGLSVEKPHLPAPSVRSMDHLRPGSLESAVRTIQSFNQQINQQFLSLLLTLAPLPPLLNLFSYHFLSLASCFHWLLSCKGVNLELLMP
jgi:hypothetical protein